MPVPGCQAAVFVPTQAARLAIVHNRVDSHKALSVFDVSMRKTKYKSDIQSEDRDTSALSKNLPHDGNLSLITAIRNQYWVEEFKGKYFYCILERKEKNVFTRVSLSRGYYLTW